ncbi:MAG: metallophosphoesterase, partial [Promethearchaeota archaeon]
MFKLDLKEGKHPIIIKPNLGQPELINLRDFKRDNGNYFKKIIFEALIIAVPKQSVLEILQYFHLNLYIQPILKDDGIFLERRGDKYPIQVVGIKRIKKLDFRDQGVLNDENCIIWDIFNSLMQVDNIFGERKNLYKIKIQIKNIKAIKRLIKEFKRNFILFDIIHDLPNRIENKINYHSIALFDKDWADFKFIHATDFHIARRNDFLSKFLKEKAINRIKINKSRKRKISKNDNFIFSKDFEFKEEFQDHRLEDLRYAKYNFNFNMRMLINYINERVKENKLDFVLITGDLIDYIDIARGNYQYKNNFYVFIEILLGVNRGLNKPPYLTDDEYINKKEIISPIFTIVGNHDYRKGHYSMRVGKIRKIFGMTKGDIKGYYDIKFFNYLKALRSRDHYLK